MTDRQTDECKRERERVRLCSRVQLSWSNVYETELTRHSFCKERNKGSIIRLKLGKQREEEFDDEDKSNTCDWDNSTIKIDFIK